jgi:hypothetical protein
VAATTTRVIGEELDGHAAELEHHQRAGSWSPARQASRALPVGRPGRASFMSFSFTPIGSKVTRQ